MRIAVVGAGGVGGGYGAALAKAGADVTFIARGAHLAAMTGKGLKVESVRGDTHLVPTQATDDPKTVGPVDVVLFCVKLWDVESAGEAIKPMVAADTAVIPLQNGVDASERLAPILGKEIRYSYQVPLSEYVRRHADIMTMAVGLIIHGDQAEQILRDKQSDLIAVGREILNNPNWPMDAALKLGVEGPFRNVPPQFGFWLGTRAKRGFGTQPSTWQNGLEGQPKGIVSS